MRHQVIATQKPIPEGELIPYLARKNLEINSDTSNGSVPPDDANRSRGLAKGDG